MKTQDSPTMESQLLIDGQTLGEASVNVLRDDIIMDSTCLTETTVCYYQEASRTWDDHILEEELKGKYEILTASNHISQIHKA